jgi:hypothetical protein
MQCTADIPCPAGMFCDLDEKLCVSLSTLCVRIAELVRRHYTLLAVQILTSNPVYMHAEKQGWRGRLLQDQLVVHIKRVPRGD